MKLRQLFTLLLLPLFTQQSIANVEPMCPSIEQIKHIEIVKSKKSAADQWVFISAPFQANDAFWEIQFVKYLSGSMRDAQDAWDKARISGPYSPSDCWYFADWDADTNWIAANLIH
jgi:hypothetical protein